MIIKFWGTRGSIPVSGREYMKYGGDTTCVEIRTKHDEIIIIDAGTGVRKLGKQLLHEQRFSFHMIFTHSHWDHLIGFPFFKPIYRRGTHIKIHGCPFAQRSIKDMISRAMSVPYFPVNYEDIEAEITYQGACSCSFQIDSVNISPISLSHPNLGNGYKFTEGEKSFVFLTDNELSFQHKGGLDFAEYVKFSEGVDLLVHDAEFTPEEYESTRTWGHSVYKDALNLALQANVKTLGLFHHNQDRRDEDVDAIVNTCKQIVRDHESGMDCFAVYDEMRYFL